MVAVMDNDAHIGPFNVGNPGEFTMIELAEMVKKVVNPSAEVRGAPPPPACVHCVRGSQKGWWCCGLVGCSVGGWEGARLGVGARRLAKLPRPLSGLPPPPTHTRTPHTHSASLTHLTSPRTHPSSTLTLHPHTPHAYPPALADRLGGEHGGRPLAPSPRHHQGQDAAGVGAQGAAARGPAQDGRRLQAVRCGAVG